MKVYFEGEFWVVNIVKPSFAIDDNLEDLRPVTPKAHCSITDEKPFRSSVLLTADLLIHLDTIQEIFSYKCTLSDDCCIYTLRLKYSDNYCSISTDDRVAFKKFSESLMECSEVDITIRMGNFWINTLPKDNVDGLGNYDIDKLSKQRIDISFSHSDTGICIKDFAKPEDFYCPLKDLSTVYTREIVVGEVDLYALCIFLPDQKQYALITTDRAQALDWCKFLRRKADLEVEISMHNFFWFPVGRSLHCQMGCYKGFDYAEEKEHFVIIRRLKDGRHFLMANSSYPSDDVIIPLDEVNNAYFDRITENKEKKKNRLRRFVLCIQYRKWHYELLTMNEHLGKEWCEKIKKISWLRPPANPKGQLKDYVDESIWYRMFQSDLELQDDFRRLKAADSVYEGILPKSSIVESVEKVSSSEAMPHVGTFTRLKSMVNNQVPFAEPVIQGSTFTKFKSMVNNQILSAEPTAQGSTFTKLKAMVNNQLNVPSIKDFLLGGKRQKKRHSFNDLKKHYESVTIQNGAIPMAENRTYFNKIDNSDNLLSAEKSLSSSGSEASVSENTYENTYPVTKRSSKLNDFTVNGIRPRSKSDDNLLYIKGSSYDFYL